MLEEMKLKDLLQLVNLLKNKNEIHNEIEDMRYVIVRTYSAGVFAGNFYSRNGRAVILQNARRLWQWSGAASLSQLAMEGVSDPTNCKFPCEVKTIELIEPIEIINTTEKAEKSIKSVKVWEL
jgi:hypothetical protein